MSTFASNAVQSIASFFQPFAGLLLFAAAISLAGYTISCGFGFSQWLYMPMSFGNTIYSDAGMYLQIGVTVFAFSLLFYMPSSARVMALEHSHRRFHITMEDVAHAYYASHRANRKDAFKLKSEFDSIRERISYLNEHPDLADLEPNVVEGASQMSHVARDLADTYSDKKVKRAKDFLVQRQQDIEDFNERLETAKATAIELRQWVQAVDKEDSVARSQLNRMREELQDILPELWKDDAEVLPPSEDAADPIDSSEDHASYRGPDLDDVDVVPDDPRVVSMLAARKRAM